MSMSHRNIAKEGVGDNKFEPKMSEMCYLLRIPKRNHSPK